jgi:rhamnose transport system substrate-binding protein
MRMTRRTRFAGALGLAVVLATAACGQGSGGSASSDDSGSSSGGSGGGDVTVAFVPKLQGIPYFEAMNTGGTAGCEAIGCTWLYQGPVEADPAAQADIVRSYVQQGVDSLIVKASAKP